MSLSGIYATPGPRYGYMESTDDDFILSMGEGLQETIRKAVLDFQVTEGSHLAPRSSPG